MAAPTFNARPPFAFKAWHWGLLLAIAVHVTSAWWHIAYGAMNTDEGFYAIATRSVAQGDVPYRDFGFTQTPVVLYANCVPLQLLGFGLFEQRALNGAWALLGLVIACVWLARRASPAWALALALLFSLSAPWMYFMHLGKTYGFTSLLTMMGAAVFLALRAGPLRAALLGFLVVAGTGARLPAAPYFGLLWLLALFPSRRPTAREIFSGLGGVALGLAIIVLPFWLAAPDAVRFWVVDFHRASVPQRLWHLTWQEIVTLAPAAWIVAAFALGFVARRRKFGAEAGVMFAAAVALGFNLLLRGAYEEYGVPFLLPLAMAAIAIVHDELKTRRAGLLALFGAAAVAQLAAAPLLHYQTLPERRGTLSCWLPPNAPAYNRALPAQLAGARQIVERALPPGAPFIGPNLILAAETNRPVPAELRMGSFSFTAEMSEAQATRLHLVTLTQLNGWLNQSDVTVAGFFARTELNYRWSMPSYGLLREDVRERLLEPIRRDFTGVYREGQFMLFVRNTALPKLDQH